MKNKGFTLIEMLLVVVILGLLLVIAVPTTMRYINSGKRSYYHTLENEAMVAGADYMETYRGLLPRNIGHVTVVDLDELVDNKFIDKVVDEKGNECEGKVTVKKVKTDTYEYYSCIKCGDYYESSEEDCKYKEEENEYADSDLYRVEVPDNQYQVNQGEEFIAPLGKVYYNNTLIKDDLVGKPKKINTSKLGNYEIVYFYHGASKKINVEVLDGNAPGKTTVVLRYDDASGKNYSGTNWYSGDIYAEYTAKDYVVNGINGSGIDYYEVSDTGAEGSFHKISSDDGTNYQSIAVNKETLLKEGNYLRYVRAVDKAGNPGPITSYRVRIDKTDPECTWDGESTDWQPNLNLPESQRVSSRTIVATCHDSVSECTEKTSSKTWVETASNKTKALKYTMKDLAGNTKVCSKTVNIYLDKTKPNISGKDIPLGSQDYTFTDNVTVDDKLNDVELSGIASVVCDPATSLKTSIYDVTCTVTDNMGLTNSVTFKAKHQYQATGESVANATYCGTHSCNPYNCNPYSCDPYQCNRHECNCQSGQSCTCNYEWCGGQLCCMTGECTPWYHCDECYDTCYRTCYRTCYSSCANTCTIYTCTDGAKHSDGSLVSTKDSMCYY